MKNILLVVNADKVSIPGIYFGCYLAQLTGSRLTGVFLENNAVAEIPALKSAYGLPYVENIVASDLPTYKEHNAACKQTVEIFKRICEEKGVRFNIHRDLDAPLEEVITETRFADLLVVSREISFEKNGQMPSEFVKDILAGAECPVMAAPMNFEGIDEILLAYDDTKSSTFAIKQFTYLFPELEDLKLTLLHICKEGDEIQREKFSQWVSAHYTYPVFKVVTGNPGSELFKYLLDKKRTLVIMGSYGRSTLSTILHPSTADSLLEDLDLPFFFAHH